jgi:hypothetical protein
MTLKQLEVLAEWFVVGLLVLCVIAMIVVKIRGCS